MTEWPVLNIIPSQYRIEYIFTPYQRMYLEQEKNTKNLADELDLLMRFKKTRNFIDLSALTLA